MTLASVLKRLLVSFLFLALMACSSEHKPESTEAIAMPDDIPFTEVKSTNQSDSEVVSPPRLAGVWRSEQPEPAGNGRYSVRELTFTGSRWDLVYTLAADKQMKNVLFTHKASGTMTIQNPSQRISGAYLVVYGFNQKTLNIMTTDKTTLKELGFDSCAISSRKEVDVSSKGCGIIPRVSECPKDYDLLLQETRKSGQYISIGNKFAEFSACSEDRRPVALGVSLIKIK